MRGAPGRGPVHRKHPEGPDAAARVATEAAGLAWLNVGGGAPVVPVVATSNSELTLARLAPVLPGPIDAHRFGRELAATHTGRTSDAPDRFGRLPPGSRPVNGHVWVGEAPLPIGTSDSWGEFWSNQRIMPYVDQLGRADRLGNAEIDLFARVRDRLRRSDPALCGPPGDPARIHGDLWAGNVVWSRGPDDAPGLGIRGRPVRGWLIDPCAHGGHRETDLAMLALFGLPHLDQVIAGYQSRAPLERGWRRRVPVHQLHPLLVHAVLFGDHYLRQALGTARAVLDL